jgi:hypothetical protein
VNYSLDFRLLVAGPLEGYDRGLLSGGGIRDQSDGSDFT